jgi:hypothetical protein
MYLSYADTSSKFYNTRNRTVAFTHIHMHPFYFLIIMEYTTLYCESSVSYSQFLHSHCIHICPEHGGATHATITIINLIITITHCKTCCTPITQSTYTFAKWQCNSKREKSQPYKLNQTTICPLVQISSVVAIA